MNTTKLEELSKWLADDARSALPPNGVLGGVCERLVTSGVPLWRVGAFVQTLHPDALGRRFVWRPGADVVIDTADFDLRESDQFRQSPVAILYASGHEVRYRLDDPESKRFPFFDELRAFGVALHVGEILFGNIGGTSRLDFTCIGRAVNLAARLEKIAGKLGRTVVASSAFAGASAADWTDLGEFPIAGFSQPQRVFGASDEGAV